jgi:CBS-domain-containing membrane protein
MARLSPDNEEDATMGELAVEAAGLVPPHIDLSDEEIVGAMREMAGYIDVTARDLREIYRRAYPRAVERSLRGLRAGELMRIGTRPAHTQMALLDAARLLVEQSVRSLPVVDDGGRVVGVLAEADFLHQLHAGSTLQLLLRLLEEPSAVDSAPCGSSVSLAMRSPAVTVTVDAGFRAIASAFARHSGSSMPVVDAEGGLLGMLVRRDFASACAGSVR